MNPFRACTMSMPSSGPNPLITASRKTVEKSFPSIAARRSKRAFKSEGRRTVFVT